MTATVSQGNITSTSVFYPTIQSFEDDVEILPPTLSLILNILYVIITVSGLTSNGIVFYLFISKKVNSTAFNLLLLNLSIADIIADIAAYPYVFVHLTRLRQYSSNTANLICAFTHGMTPFVVASAVSILTLCFISINRYVLIKYPVKGYWIKRKCNIVKFIIIVWPLCIAMMLPNVFSFEYDPRSAICFRRWPKKFNGKLWSAIIGFIGYIFPIIVMMFTFTVAGCKLWSKKLIPGNINFISKICLKRKRKAFILLGCLIIAFFVFWGPFFGYFVLSRSTKAIFPDGARGEQLRMRVVRFVFLIALCNTVADPIIYGFRGEEFRQGFHQIVKALSIKISGLRTTTKTRSNSSV